jgi:hypothetical protein
MDGVQFAIDIADGGRQHRLVLPMPLRNAAAR